MTNKTQTAFEQAHARLLTVQVVLYRFHQAGPQRGAHGGHVRGNRVSQHQRFNAWGEQGEQLRVNEAVGDRFLIAARHQQAAQGWQLGAGFGFRLRGQTRLRVTYRQTVVAVQATNLFDQINFKTDVETVTRHSDLPFAALPCNYLQTQARKQTLDFASVQLQTEHLADALGAQGNRGSSRQISLANHFNNRAGLAANDVDQQTGCPLHSFTRQLPVNPTLEAVRGIGM